MYLRKIWTDSSWIKMGLTPNLYDTFPTQHDLHEKSHSSDDSTCVIGMMEDRLIWIFHSCINDYPPTSEKLQEHELRFRRYAAFSSLQWYKVFKCNSKVEPTRTPAAIDAMVFRLSPQSTLHSQSPHRTLSKNPDMVLSWKVKGKGAKMLQTLVCEMTDARHPLHTYRVKVFKTNKIPIK